MNKRIGFVDYNLDNFHADVYLSAIRGELAHRGFSVAGCYGLREEDSRKWSEKNSVPYFSSVKKLDKHVDYYAILAPSNPETHWPLCKKVFPMGKPTYVDKTFAPNLKTAEKIFAMADKYGVAMQTASALRYTEVQAYARDAGGFGAVEHMVAWGGGRSFEEYAIHPVELTISCMGAGAERLLRRGEKNHRQLLLDFSGGRTAVINVYTNADTPFAAAVTTAEKTSLITVDSSRIFLNMTSAILDLFESGQASIDRAESLMIRRVLDVSLKPPSAARFVKL